MKLKVLLVALCVVIVSLANVCSLAQDPSIAKRLESITDANWPKEIRKIHREVLHPCADRQVAELKTHAHLGIALAAAWEVVRRTLSEEKQQAKLLKPDAQALHRFLGFVEGRLSIELPHWWESMILGAEAYDRDNVL